MPSLREMFIAAWYSNSVPESPHLGIVGLRGHHQGSSIHRRVDLCPLGDMGQDFGRYA